MKSYPTVLMALLVLGVAFVGAAYAETVGGTVAGVDVDAQVLQITQTDPATGASEAVSVSVSDATTYSGEVTALEEVIEGDIVQIEAEKDAATGNWVAKSVDVSVAEEKEEALPPAAEPAAS